MKKLLVLAMMATLLMTGTAFAGSPPVNVKFLTVRPDATAPPPIEGVAHLITIKNLFGWTDALEADNAAPGDGYTNVTVDVTNCHGFGPLPDPLSLKAGEAKMFDGGTDPKTGKPYGFNGAQCIDSSTFTSFSVVDVAVKNGTAGVYTRAEYTTSIGQDLFDIPALPDAIGYKDAGYEFSRVWNGDGKAGSPSAYIAFVNIGAEGNVRIRAIDDAKGTWAEEVTYLHKGDTFYQMANKLPFGRVVITVPPPNIGCGGCTPENTTPRIYAVIFRGHNGAGVAKAIVPKKLTVAP